MARDPILEEIPESLEGMRAYISRFRADYDSHNHDGANSRGFLTLLAETIAGRAFTIRKTSFTDNTTGLWAGLVGNTMKLFLGSASAYLKWTGTALQIAGDIIAGSLSIGSNASIDSSGNATFKSMTSLNMKAYTNFETSGRFITSVGGTGAATFGNQGVTVEPGTTGTSYARMLWWITNHVFNNNPSFVANFLALSGFESSDGAAWFGLGNPGVDGNGYSFSGMCAGFYLLKDSGVTTLKALTGDGSTTVTDLTTVANNDSVECFLKMRTGAVDFYYRKAGGALVGPVTHTTHLPSGNETYIHFSATNKTTTTNMQVQFQCAAYEH